MKKIVLILITIISSLSFAGYDALGNKDWSEGGAEDVRDKEYFRKIGTLKILNGNENSYLFNLNANFKELLKEHLFVVKENKLARMALGWYANAIGAGSMAVGTEASAYGNGTAAFGAGSSAIGYQNLALGMNSIALGKLSVALGSYSYAPDENTVSVGNDTLKRRIVNVDDAINDTDVVNKRQLDSEITKVNEKITNLDERVTTVEEKLDIHKEEIKKSLVDNSDLIRKEVKKANDDLVLESKKYTDEKIALVSAIAGLFQPNEEGRGNFSISLGGYNTKLAIAAGGGYKVNDFFSFRAGVSTNFKDGASYNAAINFEF